MSPQNKAALYRALLGGAIGAASAAIAWAATNPQYAVFAGIGGAFLTRFLAEGQFDTRRDQTGDVRSADVGGDLSKQVLSAPRGYTTPRMDKYGRKR